MGKKSKDLSPEQKRKLKEKRGRKLRRTDMQAKSTRLTVLYHKIGKFKTQVEDMETQMRLMEDSMDEMLKRVELIMTLPVIMESVLLQEEEEEKKELAKGVLEECPTCGKRFKQLKRHRCKNG